MTPDPYLDLHVDPYPDLTGADLLEPAAASDEERPQLSEDDSRLLAALSRPQPAVVSAVEDDVHRARADRAPAAFPRTGPPGPLAPVFQEPTG